MSKPLFRFLLTALLLIPTAGTAAAAGGGGSQSATQVIEVGREVSGQIEGSYFRFYRMDAPDSGTYRIYTTGSVDTVGVLLDQDGNKLAEDDDGGEATNFLIEFELAAGTYYAGVRGFSDSTSGSFTLRAERIGGGCGSATAIAVGEPVNGYISGRTTYYYRFDIAAPGIYRLWTASSTDTVGTLLDGNCEEISGDDDGGIDTNFLIQERLSQGTYYIAVRGYGDRVSGPFTLYVQVAR